jgi:hypothetical protein
VKRVTDIDAALGRASALSSSRSVQYATKESISSKTAETSPKYGE